MIHISTSGIDQNKMAFFGFVIRRYKMGERPGYIEYFMISNE